MLLLLLLLPLVIFVNDRRFVFWHFVMFRSVLLPQAVVVVVAQVLGGADPVLDDVVGRRVDHRLVRLPATWLRALAAVGGNDLRRNFLFNIFILFHNAKMIHYFINKEL